MILLSFDTEEFDVPREHGVDFPLDEAMKVSVYGTNKILDCLKKNGVKATINVNEDQTFSDSFVQAILQKMRRK